MKDINIFLSIKLWGIKKMNINENEGAIKS